ncbi:hypothetical protein Tco_1064139 [Tanacetum coccineum]
MLERGSYIPWASRFRRYLNRKRDNRKWLLKALDEGPYVFRQFTPTGATIPRLQTVDDLKGDDLLHYDAEIGSLSNMIPHSIPNEIYNYVDSWLFELRLQAIRQLFNATTAVEKDIMLGTVQSQGIQPADQNSDDGTSYESEFISEVQSSSIDKSNEQMYPAHTKIINSTIDNDQINSNIQFDSVKGNVNSGSIEKAAHVYDLCALETLANMQIEEAAITTQFAQKLTTKQHTLLSLLS